MSPSVMSEATLMPMRRFPPKRKREEMPGEFMWPCREA